MNAKLHLFQMIKIDQKLIMKITNQKLKPHQLKLKS